MQINEALSICHKKGIHIYPELKKGSWYIVKEQDGKVIKGTNPHTLAAINNQKKHIVSEAYIYYASQLKKITLHLQKQYYETDTK